MRTCNTGLRLNRPSGTARVEQPPLCKEWRAPVCTRGAAHTPGRGKTLPRVVGTNRLLYAASSKPSIVGLDTGEPSGRHISQSSTYQSLCQGKGVAPHLTHTRLAGRSGELRELPLRAYARACWRRTRILVAQRLGERPGLVGTDSASRTAAAAAGPSVCSAVRPIDELGRERRRHSCTQQPGLLR